MTKPEWRKYPHQWLPLATDLNQTEKFVWMALNDHQGNKDKSWPSQETLAYEVGIKPRMLRYVLASLETKGYLFKRRARLYGAHRNDYIVSHPTLDLPSIEEATDCRFEQATDCLPNRQPIASYSSYELTQRTDSGSPPSLRSGKDQGQGLIHSDDGWDGHLKRCRSTRTCDCNCPVHECDSFCGGLGVSEPGFTYIGDPEL